MTNIEKYKCFSNVTIKQAVILIDEGGIGFISIINKEQEVVGVLTDGDFRRAILSGKSLDDEVIDIANKDFTFIEYGSNNTRIESMFKSGEIDHIPVLRNLKLVDIITKADIPSIQNDSKKRNKEDIPVVIMAGGYGTRLAPLTNILPKALIPIDGKPMIEIIIDQFEKDGLNNFYLLLHKGSNLIKAYFEDLQPEYRVTFVKEKTPLGTAGGLSLLKGQIKKTFILTNCDILIRDNFSKILKQHTNDENLITIVTALRTFKIPYGVCNFENGGKLNNIVEKPDYNLFVNSGMYIIEPQVLDLIKENERRNMTDLIEEFNNKKMKIGVYPISENGWLDFGQWDEYKKAVNVFEELSS